MNVAVIGIQGYGASYFDALGKRTDASALAVCDLDATAAGRVADAHGVKLRFTDYRELLKHPDIAAVFIATPHFLHYPMVMDALRAGKHVFCEKPLALRGDQADEMARTARQRGLVLTCHYNQRQTDYVKALRQLVQRGLLGDIYEANVRWMARWTSFMFDSRTSWRLQKDKAGGGILIGRGSHLIDAIWYILGKRPIRSISASLHNHLTGTQVEDFASAILRFDGDLTVRLQCSYVAHSAPFRERMEYELYGTLGGASYARGDGVESALRVGRCHLADGRWEDLAGHLDLPALACAKPVSLVDDFLDAIAEHRDPTVTGEDAAYITRVLEAGYESARTGKEVAMTTTPTHAPSVIPRR